MGRYDLLKIEMEVPANDVLRALVVLGRTNGSAGSGIYQALKQSLGLYNYIYKQPSVVTEVIGNINYLTVEKEVENHFFTMHDKRMELISTQEELEALTKRISTLKNELGDL